jgi:hypothetical protein
MDPDIKDEWVSRLRSGEYEQATRRLKDGDDARCCLGVLCDIYAEQNDDGTWKGNLFLTDTGRESKVLPWQVREWADLSSQQGASVPIEADNLMEPEDLDPNFAATLSQLNDGLDGMRQHKFDEIADLIEQNL